MESIKNLESIKSIERYEYDYNYTFIAECFNKNIDNLDRVDINEIINIIEKRKDVKS